MTPIAPLVTGFLRELSGDISEGSSSDMKRSEAF
jgi:hypothetical protein